MIGEKIKHLLEKNNMTTKELADQTHIPLTTLADFLNGRTARLSIQNAQKICIALNCSLDYLVDDNVSKDMIVAIRKASRSLDAKERTLLKLFNKLNDDGKEYILEISDMLSKNNKYKKQ